MPLSEDEFKQLFREKSLDLIGEQPDEETSHDAYKDYKALADFFNSEGTLTFEKKADNTLNFSFEANNLQAT